MSYLLSYNPSVDTEIPQLDLWSLLRTADAALPSTRGVSGSTCSIGAHDIGTLSQHHFQTARRTPHGS